MASMNKQEVANLVDEEGGIYNALHWGLKASDIEDPELSAAWAELERVMPLFLRIAEMLPEPELLDPFQESGAWL